MDAGETVYDTARPQKSRAEVTALAAQRGMSKQFFAHERLAQTKAIIIDKNGKVVGRALRDMETSMTTLAEDAFKAALADAGLDRG